MGRSALLADSQSRSGLVFNVYMLTIQETIGGNSPPFLIRYRSGGTPARTNAWARCQKTCGPLSEEPGPQPSQGLPGSPRVARRRSPVGVLAGDTFWHAPMLDTVGWRWSGGCTGR